MITTYLFDDSHPLGGPKSAFFKSFGFLSSDWEQLRDALIAHARDNELDRSYVTKFGIVYEVIGQLTTPDGRSPTVLVASIIWHSEDFPRLVTALPS